MKALIVEPSQTFRKLLAKSLLEYRIEPDEATGFDSATAKLDEHQYDLICMSMYIDDGTSKDLCETIRNKPEQKNTPIILLTSAQSNDLNRTSMAGGVTEIFSKQRFDDFTQYVAGLVTRKQLSTRHQGRVLLIEDSEMVAKTISRCLIEKGYEVEHHSSAVPAIRSFADNDFELVLTDIVLEGNVSGMGVVRAIRQFEDPQKNSTPILATSGYDDQARKLELFQLGINDYISKPIFPEEMLARVANLIANQKLIRQLELQSAQLQNLAMTDQLTGLYNRHYLMDIAPKKIAQAKRHDHPLCMIVIDIDHFKSINDNQGHSAGDEVLTAVGQLLAGNCRIEDLVARYGGEEFIMIMEHCDLDNTEIKANKLRELIAEARPAGIDITASFGISELEPNDDFEDLFSRGDAALYEAKDTGRNKVVVH